MNYRAGKPDSMTYLMMVTTTINLFVQIMANYVELTAMLRGEPFLLETTDIVYLVGSIAMFGFSLGVFLMRIIYGWVLPEKE